MRSLSKYASNNLVGEQHRKSTFLRLEDFSSNNLVGEQHRKLSPWIWICSVIRGGVMERDVSGSDQEESLACNAPPVGTIGYA